MPTEARKQKMLSVANHRMQGVIAVFEDIYDPHNAAAVLRTCDAFGIHTAYFIFEKQKPFQPRKIGGDTSSSANKWLSFKTFRSSKSCISELRKEKYTCIGTVPPKDETSISLFDIDFTKRQIALFFGNEHTGLSPYTKKHMDILSTIPMYGMVESFNLSVCAGIYLSHISYIRRSQLSHPEVTKTEAQKIYKSFLKK